MGWLPKRFAHFATENLLRMDRYRIYNRIAAYLGSVYNPNPGGGDAKTQTYPDDHISSAPYRRQRRPCFVYVLIGVHVSVCTCVCVMMCVCV